jgi:hypothetical protein
MNIFILLILAIVLYIIFYIFNKNTKIEFFNNDIIFLNDKELYNILVKDEDNYYKSFFKNDLYSRKINSIDEYNNLISLSVYNFTDSQKNKLIKCINHADIFFDKIDVDFIFPEKINKIKWKLGCIKNKLYENGLPHTRKEIIIINTNDIDNYSEKKLIKTLIHEKIHLYQKKYIDDVNIYLEKNNFIKFKKREEYDNIRANPDLDQWIYKDNKKNIYSAIYNNNPSSIEDIIYYPKNNQSFEHPYEKMAIEIENMYLY